MTQQSDHIVVTGASGFIGTHIMQALVQAGEYPVGLCRTPAPGLVHGFDLENMGDLSKVLVGARAVVHCAARVHRKEDPKTELADQRRSNRDATAELLRQAETAGVERFIFLSTVAVYGLTAAESPVLLDHPTNPQTAYGQAKLEAEQLLQESAMQTAIVRVPLVYGPYAPGLWRKMVRLCDSPYPLPFDFIGNRRSMMAVENLADLIRHLVQAPDTPELLLATDQEDIGTTQIARSLRRSFGRPERLFTAPKPLLRAAAKALRRPYLYDQVFEDLRFVPTDCGWRAPVSPELALQRCAKRKA